MGYSWTARRTGCGKGAWHYERRYWQDYFRGRIQCRLPQGRHEVHQRVGRPDTQDGLLGGHEEPLYHLRQPLHRNVVVAVEATLQERTAL